MAAAVAALVAPAALTALAVPTRRPKLQSVAPVEREVEARARARGAGSVAAVVGHPTGGLRLVSLVGKDR